MPDITFNQKQRAVFPTRYHGDVSISRAKWDEICQEPERFYYRENAEKVATTLVNPDYIRYSKNHDNQFIYYKMFETFKIGDNKIKSKIKYWAVVIDNTTNRICTIYPTVKPKIGREYKEGNVK